MKQSPHIQQKMSGTSSGHAGCHYVMTKDHVHLCVLCSDLTYSVFFYIYAPNLNHLFFPLSQEENDSAWLTLFVISNVAVAQEILNIIKYIEVWYVFFAFFLEQHPLFVFLESSESFTTALKAYQSLEPGDFTGFLKLLRSPSSQRLQSRCTAFLNTMEAYHVIVCLNRLPVLIIFLCDMSELF